MGYVHDDIKLDNILVGYNDPQNIYLIDFGLAVKYLKEDGHTHVEKKALNKFSGNFLLASLNSCRGNNKSRRDDMQALMYMMIYLLNDRYLPWVDFNEKFPEYDFDDLLIERLDLKYTEMFFKITPKPLREMVKNVLTLKFDGVPQYDEIIETLKKEIKN